MSVAVRKSFPLWGPTALATRNPRNDVYTEKWAMMAS